MEDKKELKGRRPLQAEMKNGLINSFLTFIAIADANRAASSSLTRRWLLACLRVQYPPCELLQPPHSCFPPFQSSLRRASKTGLGSRVTSVDDPAHRRILLLRDRHPRLPPSTFLMMVMIRCGISIIFITRPQDIAPASQLQALEYVVVYFFCIPEQK